MIDRNTQFVEWDLFLCELEDAKEHLEGLLREVKSDPTYDESSLRVDLGHVYAHLNRAWWRSAKALDDSDREPASKFPDDLTPIG